MTGDGFGGRGWYVAHNYQVGAYSAYTICGDSNQLYGWGSNVRAELGNGTYISSDTPVRVMQMTNVKFYTTGYLSAAIKMDETAWVWGCNGFCTFPRQMLDDVKFLDAGVDHVVFVKNDGTVRGIGGNYYGELGDGNSSILSPETTPVQMLGITNAVRAVAVGQINHQFNSGTAATLILLTDGTVKITGGDGWFQTINSTIPVTVEGLSNIVDIKGNSIAAYALNSAGEVFSFGKDVTIGESIPALGLGQPTGNITSPAKVVFPAGSTPIVALSSNNDGFSCMALDSNHNVYAWGYNVHGQLGDGTYISRSTPKLVATNVIDIFAGENFSYILKADNTLWATGESGYEGYPLGTWGSIWMNLPNIRRNVFTQINPSIAPMNLCAPKPFGVVPIRLINFSCKAVGNTANLQWTSAEEINSDRYVVEYSKDGSNFQSIAIIPTKGSNSKYNYLQQQVNGTAFYRLKMMDKDGSFKYSEIRMLKFDNKAGFTIAPNPANGIVYVLTKSNAVIRSIEIVSVDGKLVKTISNYNNGQGISISNLSKGTYILKAVYQNNEIEFGRFIKI